MNIAQVIEKVKNNLLIQEDLKSQLEELKANYEITQEKIANLEDVIYDAETDEIDLKESIIRNIKDASLLLMDNLELYSKNVFGDQDFKYGLKVSFMDKKRVLTVSDYELWSSSEKHNVEDFVEKMFNDYLTKGKTIFNKNSIEKIEEFKKLYQLRPDVVKEKLISMEMSKYVRNLKFDLGEAKNDLAKSVNSLKKLDKEISKTISFKSELLKKIFTKKAKLIEKKENALLDNKNLNNVVKNLESKLHNKSELKEKANKYVQSEIDALMNVVEWISMFEKGNEKLNNFSLEHIEVLNDKLNELNENLAKIKTNINESTGLLNLNKKLTNNIVENALMNKNIIAELNGMNFNNVQKQDQNAVKFIENKYNNYIHTYIETLVK